MKVIKSIHRKVDQNTDEWFGYRLGIATASKFSCLMVNCFKGKSFKANAEWGKVANEYACQLAHESLTQTKYADSFSNKYMERGHEHEPYAKELYEYETFYQVNDGGFFEYKHIGASPDGLIGDDGVIEIKTAIEKVHWERIESGTYDTTYKWQIMGELLLSNRKWCDFVSYCPEFYEPKRLYIHTVERNEDMIEQLYERSLKFNELVKQKIDFLQK